MVVGSSARPRTGRIRACDGCRKKKYKCDGLERREIDSHSNSGREGLDVPCTECSVSGKLCTYDDKTSKRTVPKAHIERLEERVIQTERYLSQHYPDTDFASELGPPVIIGSWRDADSSSKATSRETRPQRGATSKDAELPFVPPARAPEPRTPPASASQLTIRPLKMDIKRLLASPRMSPVQPDAVLPDPVENLPPSIIPSQSLAKMLPSQMEPTLNNNHEPPHRPSQRSTEEDDLPSSDDEYCDDAPPRLGSSDDPTGMESMLRPRYHGKSSQFSLVRVNRAWKRDVEAHADQANSPKGSRAGSANDKVSVSTSQREADQAIPKVPSSSRANPLVPPLPPPNILWPLVDLYFRHVNIVWPILHRPTFEADITRQRHRKDLGFACVVLAVCAVASRYSEDRRVFAKVHRRNANGTESSAAWALSWAGPSPWIDDFEQAQDETYEDAGEFSAGWKYFDRVQRYRNPTLEAVTLTDLQTTFLIHRFLLGIPHSSAGYGWSMIGAAIRQAQDQGVHREFSYGDPSLEGELWKRVFWCLVVSDRLVSPILGRSCYSRPEDVDVELPLEIDDEFWTFPDTEGMRRPREQPAGRPSYIAGLNAHIRLTRIYVGVMRTLYASNKSKPHLGLSGNEWEKDVLNKLQEQLKEWIDFVPRHLRLKTAHPNPVWRTQSATIHLTYFHVQMHIHEYFLPFMQIRQLPPTSAPLKDETLKNDSSITALSSKLSSCQPLAMCASAARSNAQILRSLSSYVRLDAKAWVQLGDIPTLIAAAFMTGVMLLTVRAAKATITHPSSTPSSSTITPKHLVSCTKTTGGQCPLDDSAKDDDELLFNACADTLAMVQDRWPRASSGLNILMTTSAADPYKLALKLLAFPGIQPLLPPSTPPTPPIMRDQFLQWQTNSENPREIHPRTQRATAASSVYPSTTVPPASYHFTTASSRVYYSAACQEVHPDPALVYEPPEHADSLPKPPIHVNVFQDSIWCPVPAVTRSWELSHLRTQR